MKLGNPIEMNTQIGPLAKRDIMDELHDQIKSSIKLGAKLIYGGDKIDSSGFYYQPTILSNVKIEDNKCIINIVDQGSGIPLEYKDRIFDRFYTDRSDKKRSHSGLGLSISKNIISSFGGTINLIKSSHLGFKGACFEIILPLKD